MQPHDEQTCSELRPWPGLFSYSETDRKFFFGRKRETEQLATTILNQRAVVVFGPSGTGKTSLLHAGVFPELRKHDILPVTLRSGQIAQARNQTLCGCVKESLRAACRTGGYELDETAIPPLTSEDSESLWEYLQRIEIWSPGMDLVEPLLLFDQFEEWLRIRKTGEPLSLELAGILENYLPDTLPRDIPDDAWRSRIAVRKHLWRIVLCLREDCIGGLDDLRGLMPSVMSMTNRFPLRRMHRQQAREAILGPGGGIVDKETAERMLDFFSGSEASELEGEVAGRNATFEPALLSHFCRELNEKRLAEKADRIRVDDMHQAAETVLRGFYAQCFASFASDTARRFVEDALIDPSGDPHRTFATDAQATHAGVRPEDIEHLIARRLLRRESRLGGTHLELSHDVLIPAVRESRDSHREREQIEGLERRRLEAEEKATLATRERNRFRNLTIAATAFAFLALLAVVAALWQTHEAKRLQAEAEDARKKAEGMQSYLSGALPRIIEAKMKSNDPVKTVLMQEVARAAETFGGESEKKLVSDGPANIIGQRESTGTDQDKLRWFSTLSDNPIKTLAAGEKAVALLDHDNSCPARMNLAHAYLFNDRFDEAKSIHERYLGTTFEDGRAWNDELRNDFKLLRKAGHDHPDMARIESMLEQVTPETP